MSFFDLPANAGLEDFDEEDVVIPRRIMIQPTSKVDGMPDVIPGTFVDITSKVAYGKTMRVVVLAAKKKRTLFYEYNSGNKGIRCYSLNGRVPFSGAKEKVSETCDACEYRNKDSEYDLLCYEVDTESVFWFRSKGASYRPVRNFVGTLTQQSLRPMQFEVTFACPKQANAKGVYYQLMISDLKRIDEDSELAEKVVATYRRCNVVAGEEEIAEALEETDSPF